MVGRWFTYERDLFLKGISSLFRNAPSLSNKSRAASERNNDIDNLIKRVTGQIIESRNLGMKWDTPEEWDENFYKLGGGQSRRKSNKILSKMSWDTFLEISDKILNSLD